MSDDYGLSPKQWPRLIRESEHRALLVQNSPRCDVCGKGVVTYGYTRHAGCEPNTLAGTVCICNNGCSHTHWGNGTVECDPRCVPCTLMRGRSLSKRKR